MKLLIPKNYTKILKKINQDRNLLKKRKVLPYELKKFFFLFDFSLEEILKIFVDFRIEYFFFKKKNSFDLISSYSSNDKLKIFFSKDCEIFSIISENEFKSALLYYFLSKYLNIKVESQNTLKIISTNVLQDVSFLTLDYFLEKLSILCQSEILIEIYLNYNLNKFTLNSKLKQINFLFKKKIIQKEFNKVWKKHGNSYTGEQITDFFFNIKIFNEKTDLNKNVSKIFNSSKKKLTSKIKKNLFFKNQMLLLFEKEDNFWSL